MRACPSIMEMASLGQASTHVSQLLHCSTSTWYTIAPQIGTVSGLGMRGKDSAHAERGVALPASPAQARLTARPLPRERSEKPRPVCFMHRPKRRAAEGAVDHLARASPVLGFSWHVCLLSICFCYLVYVKPHRQILRVQSYAIHPKLL